MIASSEGVTWRSLLALGVLGGLLPCPSALIVLLAAISLGQVVWGMLLIVAFSMGLAFVLTAVGSALVLGTRLHHFIPAAWRRHAGGWAAWRGHWPPRVPSGSPSPGC